MLQKSLGTGIDKTNIGKMWNLINSTFLFIIGKNIIGDLMNNFELSVDLARQTIECGGEVSRAEETVRRLNNYDCNVFATTSLIVAQKGEKLPSGEYTRMKLI